VSLKKRLEVARGAADRGQTQPEVVGLLERDTFDIERRLRKLGYRATFFHDTEDQAGAFFASLPARADRDAQASLELRFFGRLRPSRRIYGSIVLSTVVATLLTLVIAAFLFGTTSDEITAKSDSLITLLVFVPAALFGGILTSARGGLTKELLRHWVTTFAIFGAGLPLTLAVVVATVGTPPSWLLWAVLLLQLIGLGSLLRADFVRRRHKGYLPRTLLMRLAARMFRMPHPVDVVTLALLDGEQDGLG